MTRVKICGITNVEDALVAVEAGADALGFIFVEHTPRFMTPSEVAPIVRALPPFVTPVGVFWDHPAGHVKAVAEACGLRALQFHGDETPEDLDGYALPVIKTIKVPPAPTIDAAPARRPAELVRRFASRGRVAAILLDSAERWSEDGQARRPLEWDAVQQVAATRCRLILSGGLTANNVTTAIGLVRPYAVDVNSGVERRPGRKDHDALRRFVAAVRSAP